MNKIILDELKGELFKIENSISKLDGVYKDLYSVRTSLKALISDKLYEYITNGDKNESI